MQIQGQGIDETATFKFLNIPSSSRHNYLGKAAIVTFDPDIDIALANPALIQYHTRNKIMASSALYFTSLYGNLAYSGNNSKFDIPFVAGVNFISYGQQIQTDVQGNQIGKFNPTELSLYGAASKTYENYTFGLNVKFAYGDYYVAKIAGVSADMSMLYRDVYRDIYVSFMLKNVGYKFIGEKTRTASMPFDMQLGFSKKLKHFPLRFSIVAQDLYLWNSTNSDVDYGVWPLNKYYSRSEMGFLGNLMSHFIFGGEINFGTVFKVGASYDVKKSIEGRFEQFRGLNGLALGFGVYTRKYNFGYSYSRITPISVNHQFTLTANLNEFLRR
jgi:hypothetical protein